MNDNDMRLPARSKNAYTAFKLTLKPSLYLILDIIVQQSKSFDVTVDTICEILDHGIWKNHIYSRLKQLKSQGIIIEKNKTYHIGPALMQGVNLWHSRRGKETSFSQAEIDTAISECVTVSEPKTSKCKNITYPDYPVSQPPVSAPVQNDVLVQLLQQQQAQQQQIQQLMTMFIGMQQPTTPVALAPVEPKKEKTVVPRYGVPVTEAPKTEVIKEEINPYELVKNALRDPEVVASLQAGGAKFNRTDDGSIGILVRELFGGNGPLESFSSNDEVFEALLDIIVPNQQPKGVNRYFWKPTRFYSKSNWNYDSWREAISTALLSELEIIVSQGMKSQIKQIKWTLLDDGGSSTQTKDNQQSSFDENLKLALAQKGITL